MSWGDLLTDSNLWKSVGSAIPGPIGTGISFLSNLVGYKNGKDDGKEAENSYYSALTQQQQLVQMQSQLAKQNAAWQQALRSSVLTQTSNLGANLSQAQQNMGAMPQVTEGSIQQDYSNIKSTQLGDFNDMLRLVESQGRSNQIERLGGAGSYAADTSRQHALVSEYAPKLQELDNNAMATAIARASAKMNLTSTNRQNTLNEISGVLTPQITADTALLNGMNGETGLYNANTANSYLANAYKSLNAEGAAEAGTNAEALSKSLPSMLSSVFNPTNGSSSNSTLEEIIRKLTQGNNI